jgi:hypothetical protein
MLFKPLLLALMALILLFFSDSALLFDLTALIASTIGLRDLYRLVKHPDTIRFSSTLAISILLGYGLGSLIYLISHATLYAADYQEWAHQGLRFYQSGLSQALAASLLASSVLYLWAGIERPAYTSLAVDALTGVKSERFVWLGVVVTMLAVYAGEIGYMGTITNESGNVSALGSLARLIIPPLVPYTFLLIACQRNVAKKVALGVAVILLVATLFVLGRRLLLYAFVLSAVALGMHGYRLTRRVVAVATAYSLIGLVVLYYGFNFFIALRFSVNELGSDASLAQLIGSALVKLGGSEASIVSDALANNIGSRPFILSYLGGLMEIDSNQTPMYGGELLYSLQMAIPSLLMPGKTNFLPRSPEVLVHPLYGIPIFDGPNSFLVTGFDDFGLIGAIIYPLAIIWFFSFFYKALRSLVRDPAIRIFVFFTLMFQLLCIEQGSSAVFVMIRNLIIVIGIMWCLGKLPVFRLTPSRIKTEPGAKHYDDPANPD